MPHAARDLRSPKAAKLQAVAWPAEGWAILPVPINEIGDLVVERHVINLRDRQLNAVPSVPAVHGNAHASVIYHGHAVAVGGINPHLVIVPTGSRRHVREGMPAVKRPRESRSEIINLARVVRGDFLARVIVRASADLPVRINQLPVFPAIIRAPQLTALC